MLGMSNHLSQCSFIFVIILSVHDAVTTTMISTSNTTPIAAITTATAAATATATTAATATATATATTAATATAATATATTTDITEPCIGMACTAVPATGDGTGNA